jgi:hypothetical protein
MSTSLIDELKALETRSQEVWQGSSYFVPRMARHLRELHPDLDAPSAARIADGAWYWAREQQSAASFQRISLLGEGTSEAHYGYLVGSVYMVRSYDLAPTNESGLIYSSLAWHIVAMFMPIVDTSSVWAIDKKELAVRIVDHRYFVHPQHIETFDAMSTHVESYLIECHAFAKTEPALLRPIVEGLIKETQRLPAASIKEDAILYEPCHTCWGSGQVKCPLCNGGGLRLPAVPLPVGSTVQVPALPCPPSVTCRRCFGQGRVLRQRAPGVRA